MCGIIGIAGTRDVAPLIVDALKRLEYRGYDSAGVATLDQGHIHRRRSPGKLNQLERLLEKTPLHGFTAAETSEYVQQCLQLAGAERPLFSDDALTALHDVSGGIPRRINRIGDMALLVGFAEQRTIIAAEQIESLAGPDAPLTLLVAAMGDKDVALMRAHGSVACGSSLQSAVFRAVYTEVNARIQHWTQALGGMGPMAALNREEGVLADAVNQGAALRAWDLWRGQVRAQVSW